MIPVAAFTGALLAFTLLLLADAVRGRVRGPHELADATEAPFLGEMSDAEGDRLVAARVRLAHATSPVRSLLVAGFDGEGAGRPPSGSRRRSPSTARAPSSSTATAPARPRPSSA